MRKLSFPIALIAVAAGLSGCAHHRAVAADQFAVSRNAPLIIPPDFNLAPPVAGTQAISATEAQQQAIDVLFGGPAVRSPGEISLLDTAGRNDAQLGIRSQVWDPDTRIVDKGQETLQILAAANTSSNVASAEPGR
jgi:hypothetical protein